MSNPKISVIIPVYNVEKYIKRCLDSLLNQTFKDFEVVVVNDATPDQSMVFVEDFFKKWEKVTIVEHEKNMGLMWTRRTGYQAAKGDYFVFLDSDDWLPDNALEIFQKEIIKTNADIVCGAYTIMNDEGPVNIKQNQLNYGNTSEAVCKSMLKNEFSHCIWGKIFNADLFRLYKYDTFKNFTNGEDGLLFYQLLQNAKQIISIPESVYFYYHNMNSSTNVKLSNQAIESIMILNSYRTRLKKNYPMLSKDFDAKISSVLIDLMYSTNEHSLISNLIKEYNLSYYLKNTTVLRSHSLINCLKLLIRKYL